jgi:hypothetical protein
MRLSDRGITRRKDHFIDTLSYSKLFFQQKEQKLSADIKYAQILEYEE